MTLSLVEDYHISPDQCKAIKKLFRKQLEKLRTAINKARTFHRDHTFQGIGPTRVLVAGEQPAYTLGMEHHITEIRKESARFIADLPAHMEAERTAKADAFRIEDYPAASKLEELFTTDYLIMPLPEPGDFLKSMAGDAAEKLKKQFEKALENTTENVRQQVLSNMLKLIAETAESLAGDGPIVDKENRKGPLAKLREYMNRVPTLNITNDPQINEMLAECKKRLDVSTEVLRGSEFYRKDTAKAALLIAARFGQVGARKMAA
jgi:ElaB/YqjD/DUF883 family membrane-anchored ribosome-binding protein